MAIKQLLITVNSEPRRRQPSPSLHRKDQNRLRVVPRRSTQLMRKKTEMYLACDDGFRSWLAMFCFPVAVCVLSSLICMLSYTVIIPNARILHESLRQSTLVPIEFASPGSFNINYIAITGCYNMDCFSATKIF